MYLEKIEILGFKSFGDAVKLPIPKGITGVIGPNGSGKSNVADAIRWVLGEQSAKTLRGTKMEDIIFAGTEKRKPLGYAEVALHIKNDDHKLAIDYEEVAVKRRVYRSGESEYFMNGSLCRLRDIQELFMDTGVGKEGYSIIGQGQIDKVLSSKPEDRRNLFEEAAGIYKYKVRRLEAERKLEKEKDNLLRINDIMVEIEGRLEPLEKEAEKTKLYLTLKDDLKERELNVFIYEIDRIKERLLKVRQDKANLEQEMEATKKQRAQTVEEQAACKVAREALFESIQDILRTVNTLEKEEQQKKADIALNEERILSITNLLSQIEKDTQKQADYKALIQEQLQVFQSKKTGLELEKTTQQEILQKTEEKMMHEQEVLSKMESQLEDSKTGLYGKTREIDLLRGEVDKKDNLDEQMDYRYTQLQETIARMNSEITHQEVHLQVQHKKHTTLKDSLDVTQGLFVSCDEKKNQLEQSIKEKQHAMQQLEHETVQTDRQLNWLHQIKNDFEGYFQSVKQVLTLKKQEQAKWQGILGVTADLIEVPERYEVAMVTALGGAMQNIVTQSERDAKAMIQVMKQKGIGKVTFLPLDTIQPNPLTREVQNLKQEPGFLGLASELVRYEPFYAGLVDYLLGRILIVEGIEQASALAKKYKYRYKIVTLEGEVFNAGGSLSGGSNKNNKNNIFARTRELHTLEDKRKQLVHTEKVYQEGMQSLQSEQREVLKQWDTLTQQLMAYQDQEKELMLEISKVTSGLELTKQSQVQLVEEKLQIQSVKEKAYEEREHVLERIASLEHALSDEEEAVKSLEEVLATTKEATEVSRQHMTEQKIALSQTIQNLVHIEEQITNTEKAIADTKDQHTDIVSRQEQLKRDKAAREEDIVRLHQAIEEIEETIIATHAKKEMCEADKHVLDEKEAQVEQALEAVIEKTEQLKEEHFRLEHQEEQLKTQDQTQHQIIWDQYELTYTDACAFKKELGDMVVVKKEADTLRARIKTLGNINVNAVDEYHEIKTRYTFLNTQREDIAKAEDTLKELIERLTEQMHTIFKEQFEAIAANFTEVFKELFGGGTAFLQLVDESNILESGIDIIVKPPGKKLQNMTLLSGGERTLTAIALLFGILKLKPSPFCVLDEIEAALDDANVLRFADYLSSLSQGTQFIVITHRKGTMERADTLYGVTMQERGISTVLSIKLEEATHYLDQKSS